MFTNIGSKLQTYAKLIFFIEIMATLTSGFIMFINVSTVPTAIVIIIAGFIISHISFLLLYGIGQMITQTEYIYNQTQLQEQEAAQRADLAKKIAEQENGVFFDKQI